MTALADTSLLIAHEQDRPIGGAVPGEFASGLEVIRV